MAIKYALFPTHLTDTPDDHSASVLTTKTRKHQTMVFSCVRVFVATIILYFFTGSNTSVRVPADGGSVKALLKIEPPQAQRFSPIYIPFYSPQRSIHKKSEFFL